MRRCTTTRTMGGDTTPDVKWIKIVTDIFDDDKILLIESMPEADAIIVIWFKLLCLAGKQNNSGVFLLNGRIAYTDEMFATIFRRPLNTVRLALKTFEQFGMIEIINDTITIPNWGKHQTLDKIEAKNEYMRGYMREYREKQKALSDGKANCKTNSKANVSEADKIREDIDKNREDKKYIKTVYPNDFEAIWKIYPNGSKKKDAFKAWLRIQPNEELIQTITKDIRNRIEGMWKNKDVQYIPHLSTYLNQERWLDEPAHPQPSKEYEEATAENIEEWW